MNQREQNEAELQHLRETVEEISGCWANHRINADGDIELNEDSATKISLLLDNC